MSRFVEGDRVRVAPGSPEVPESLWGSSGTLRFVAAPIRISQLRGRERASTLPQYIVWFDRTRNEEVVSEACLVPALAASPSLRRAA